MKYILVLSALMIGCSGPPKPDAKTFSELVASLKTKPFFVEEEQHPYALSLQYQPAWFQARRELLALGKNGEVRLDQVDRALDSYRGNLSFLLKIGPHPDVPVKDRPKSDIVNYQPNLASFSANLHKLLFNLNDKIYLLGEGERIPLVHHYLDRNWGLGATNYLLLTFPETFNDVSVAELDAFEVVVQNLTPSLPEIRFSFEKNPIVMANFSSKQIKDLLERSKNTEKPAP